MANDEEPLLTIDEAYRATWHFVAQYATREPADAATRFRLMLGNMELDGHRRTVDPAAWHDWIDSVSAARASSELPFPHLRDQD